MTATEVGQAIAWGHWACGSQQPTQPTSQ